MLIRQLNLFILSFILLCSIKLQAQKYSFSSIRTIQNIDSSISYSEKYLSTIYSDEYSNEFLEVISFLNNKYLIKTEYKKSELLLSKILNYKNIKPNPIDAARIYVEYGNLERSRNNYPLALKYYIKADKIFTLSKNWNLLIICKIELAEFYRKIGNYDLAKSYLLEASRFIKNLEFPNPPLLLKLYNRSAAIKNETNQNRSSIYDSFQAINEAKKTNDKYNLATSYNELGFSYKNLGELDSSELYYKKAEEIFFKIGADREGIHSMNNRAMLYAHNSFHGSQNLYSKKLVLDTYNQIINIVESKQINYPLESVYFYMYLESLSAKDSLRAFNYFTKYHTAEIKRLESLSNAEIIKISEKYENEIIKKELQLRDEELHIKEITLERRKREIITIYIFVSVLTILVLIIGILLFKNIKNNKKLNKQNQEKDILIQEIHHRVKNNLQFVSSIINMQLNSNSDETQTYLLSDASRRIKAMVLVHEMLYQNSEKLGISIKKYLEELISSINNMVNSNSIQIRFNTKIEDHEFDIQSSIAIGIITSELITNSIKYAFHNVENPQIDILMKIAPNNTIQFIHRDNGKGYIEINEERKKLGMRLIDIFSRQLKGTYHFKNENGYVYELNFKLN